MNPILMLGVTLAATGGALCWVFRRGERSSGGTDL